MAVALILPLAVLAISTLLCLAYGPRWCFFYVVLPLTFILPGGVIQIEGLPDLSISAALILPLIAIWMVGLVTGSFSLPRLGATDVFILLAFLWMTLSQYVATRDLYATQWLARLYLLHHVLLYFMLRSMLKDARSVRQFARTILPLAILVVFAMLWETRMHQNVFSDFWQALGWDFHDEQ